MKPENEFAEVLMTIGRSPLICRIVQRFRHWRYRARFWFVKSKPPF